MTAYPTSGPLTKGAQTDASMDRRTWMQASLSAGGLALFGPGCLAAASADKRVLPPTTGLGLNLAAVRYWTSERPFQNLFLTASKQVPQRDQGKWGDGDPLDVDQHGWIRSFRSRQHAAMVIDLKPGHPKTTYEMTYQGPPGALQFSGPDGRTVQKQGPATRLLIRQRQPVSNVVITERGRPVTQTFAEPFLERCRNYQVLRVMNWQLTNEDRELNWSKRTTPQSFTQADQEVALEYVLELCNTANTGMWYCVHHKSDDEFVRQSARFVKEHWKGDRPIYLEHSNEVWNGMFPQFKYCNEQKEGNWLHYHVRRTAEVTRIFRQEGVEVISVLGLQSVAFDRERYLLDKVEIPEEIDATAIAPYFGGEYGRLPEKIAEIRDGSVERLLDACSQSIEGLRREISEHRTLADERKLKLLAYEGGQHLAPAGPAIDDPKLVELFIAANKHPRMYDLYRDYLRLWDSETDGALMCLFESVSDYSKFGCWGLQEYDGQDAERAPKYRAVMDHLQAKSASA